MSDTSAPPDAYLLTMACLLGALDPIDASPDLVPQTTRRGLRLRRTVLRNRLRDPVASNRALGYCACVQFQCGRLLGSSRLLQRGMAELLEAAKVPHDPVERHWDNALTYADKLLELNQADAAVWSGKIAEAIRDREPAKAAEILQARRLPHLKQHWTNVAPDLWSSEQEEF